MGQITGADHRHHAWCCCRCSCRSPSFPASRGQLFRQFAVAVSVSMVISAINALTLSPASARHPAARSHGPNARPDALCPARRSTMRARRLRRRRASALVRRAFGLSCWLAVVGGVWLSCADYADRFPAQRRTRAPSSSKSSCPRAPPSTAHAIGRERVEDICSRPSRGVRTSAAIIGLQLARRLSQVEQRLLIIVLLKPFAGAPGSRPLVAPMRSSPGSARSSQPSATPTSSPSTCRRSSGSGTGSGFEYQLAGSSGRQHRSSLAAQRARTLAAANQDSRSRACSRPITGAIRRSSISTSTARRRRRSAFKSADVLQRPAGDAGRRTMSTTSTCSAAPGRSTSRAKQRDRKRVDDIYRIHVRNKSGEMVPLRSIAEPRLIVGPQTIIRLQQLSARVTINGGPAAGRQSGRRAGGDGAGRRQTTLPHGLCLRMDGDGTAGEGGRRPDRRPSSALADAVRLPVPGGALRELDDPGAGAAVRYRSASLGAFAGAAGSRTRQQPRMPRSASSC